MAEVYCNPRAESHLPACGDQVIETTSADIAAAVSYLTDSTTSKTTCLHQVSHQLTVLTQVSTVLNTREARVQQLQAALDDVELERSMLANRCHQLQRKLDAPEHSGTADTELLGNKLAAKEKAERRV